VEDAVVLVDNDHGRRVYGYKILLDILPDAISLPAASHGGFS
jgi:hypothetical protein